METDTRRRPLDAGASALGIPGGLLAIVLSWLPFVASPAARAADDLVAASAAADGAGLGDDESDVLAISRNGNYLVLASYAGNLVEGMVANGDQQLFLYDRISKWNTLITHAAGLPTEPSNDESYNAFVSDDGRFVAFETNATDLVAGVTDTNSLSDVYLWDRLTGQTVLVSRSSAAPTQTGNAGSFVFGLSADGRFLLYLSNASDLPGGITDGNGAPDLLLFDRLGATRLVSHVAGATESTTANEGSFKGSLSADGNWVAFTSFAGNLVAGLTDGNDAEDAFLWERAAPAVASTRLVSRSVSSVSTTANAGCSQVDVAPDGGWVLFLSEATDTEGTSADTNGARDLYQFDRAGDVVRLVSHLSGSLTVTASGGTGFDFSGSASGEYVAFVSSAADLVPGQIDGADSDDVFLWSRTGGSQTLVSRRVGTVAQTGNGFSDRPAISTDGALVAFGSEATNLVSGVTDGNGNRDVFRWERTGGGTSLVSHADGQPTVSGDGGSFEPFLSGDGLRVAFRSGADDLAAGDENGFVDAFYGGPEEIFTDGFAGGTTGAWSSTLP